MNNEEKILSILETMQADVSGLKTDVSGLKTDVKTINATLEKHGELLAQHGHEIAKINVTLENQIIPDIQLLAEGQSVIVKKLNEMAPKNRVEVLEDEMAFMKSVIRALSQDVEELKKAQ